MAINAFKPGAPALIQQVNTGGTRDHVVAKVKDTGRFRQRRLHHLATYGLGVQFRVHNSDINTALRGLLERVFFHWETNLAGVRVMARPFRPSYPTVCNILGVARSDLLRKTGRVTPLTREQFLAPLSGSHKARYVEAADSVELNPVTQKDAYMSTFVKAEKLNITAKQDPDPRVIQPRTPRYCYAVGLFVKAVEPAIYRALNRLFGSKTVMKGLNADQRGRAIHKAWTKYSNPVAVGLDASRWDQHVSMALLRLEHSVYTSMIHDSEFARLLEMQLVSRGFVRADDGEIKYTVEGSRMSGDMNTALGNVLLMCLCVYAYLRTKNFPASLINDGDDCVVICEKENLPQFGDLTNWFARLGIVMKVEAPVYELEGIEFCQSHPVEVYPDVWRMIRNPNVVLDKDQCVVNPVTSQIDHDYYRNAIGMCGLALAGDVPVFCEFYPMLMRGTKMSKRLQQKLDERRPKTGMDYLALGMNACKREPWWGCRVSFAKAFGIWPDMQVALEESFRLRSALWQEPMEVPHVADVFSTPL